MRLMCPFKIVSLQSNGGLRWFSPERTSMVSLPRKRDSRISRHSTKRDCCLRRNGRWCHSAEVLLKNEPVEPDGFPVHGFVSVDGECPDFRRESRENGTVPFGLLRILCTVHVGWHAPGVCPTTTVPFGGQGQSPAYERLPWFCMPCFFVRSQRGSGP